MAGSAVAVGVTGVLGVAVAASAVGAGAIGVPCGLTGRIQAVSTKRTASGKITGNNHVLDCIISKILSESNE
jgi:hypothetical protein